jgi:hypothetical protein
LPFFVFTSSEILNLIIVVNTIDSIYNVVRGETEMFIKILTKIYGGKEHHYASLVENKRLNGKVIQTVKANLGPVTEEQIPYLKAAYARKKPRLVYDDD